MALRELPDFPLDEAERALSYIPATLEREQWARVAMALKAEYGADGRDLFVTWSATAGKAYDKGATTSTWKSVRSGGGVGIGTLIHLAQAHGYVRPKADLSEEERQARVRAAEERRRRAAERQAAVERLESEAEGAVAELAALAFRRLAAPEGPSPYFDRKRVHAHGVRFVRAPFLLVIRGDPDNLEPVRCEVLTDRAAVTEALRAERRDDVSIRYLRRGAVLVPLRDLDAKIWNIQVLWPTGRKSFLRHGRKAGLFHLIQASARQGRLLFASKGSGRRRFFFAEGYATAATFYERSGIPGAVAFDAGNLLRVAEAFLGVETAIDPIVTADNDRHNAHPQAFLHQAEAETPRMRRVLAQVRAMYPSVPVEVVARGDPRPAQGHNIGVANAIRAAAIVGGAVLIPEFVGKHERKAAG